MVYTTIQKDVFEIYSLEDPIQQHTGPNHIKRCGKVEIKVL